MAQPRSTPAAPFVVQREQSSKFGTQITKDGVRFRLWAPQCEAVKLAIDGRAELLELRSLPRGWHELEVEGLGAGTRYQFVLPDGQRVPDPASRHQPQDVDGPSEVIDPRAFPWTDRGWGGRSWEETVIYELHVGTFTEDGTFRAVIERLDYLAELGITAIELMPIADFRGRWSWGYDGVLQFAPASAYGRPEDLKALIDAAHARSMMVFLDVVYNHFGPEGNFMALYMPLNSQGHESTWGKGLNFDDEGAAMVRNFLIANARYWLNEFHFDGLRFDAIHAIKDDGPKHLLQELAEKVRAATDGRHIHLMVENAANGAGWLKRGFDAEPWLYTAQWSDDIHHGLHHFATGERGSYYADYEGRLDLLGRALAEGLGYQGEKTPKGEVKGEPVVDLPASAFVAYIQNHDQVGNRPGGERLGAIASNAALRALASIYLLAPQIPLLFMGEEWDSRRPFFYFTDMSAELGDKIRQGRKEEFKEAPDGVDHSADDLPDPNSEDAFRASKIDWAAVEEEHHADHRGLYKKLLEIRRKEIIPRLSEMGNNTGRYEIVAGHALRVRWDLADGTTLHLLANLHSEPLEGLDLWGSRHLWLEGYADAHTLRGWGVIWSLEGAVNNP